jgi:hypothetical protein
MLIAYLRGKRCALCRIVYNSHQAADHFFCETVEDIPLDEWQSACFGLRLRLDPATGLRLLTGAGGARLARSDHTLREMAEPTDRIVIRFRASEDRKTGENVNRDPCRETRGIISGGSRQAIDKFARPRKTLAARRKGNARR